MSEPNPESNVLKHERLYDGKIIQLHVDKILLPSGNEAIREVVVHPGGVVAVPILDDGRLLLIRQFRYALKKHILEFPAGKLEGSQSPDEAIARELEEETGYSAGSLTHQCSFYMSPGISTEIVHLFVARNLKPVPQQLEEGEHIVVEPHELKECLEFARLGEIRDGKTLLGLFWYSHEIFMK